MTGTSTDTLTVARGPLAGVRIVEFAGLGPAPFACMLLADMGAEVVRIARPGTQGMEGGAVRRSRIDIELDLKNRADLETAARLAEQADVLVEGFRPGVMERLGLGPEPLLQRNPRLVYARMTGWGQTGPRAPTAGHDINYIAITGALHAMGERGRAPAVPLNLVGDYGGGAMYLVAGVLAALLQARTSGHGQVVDCAICDGVVSMLSIFHRLLDTGSWRDQRQSNLLDGGAHFYGCYECQDGGFLAVGAIEPQFYAQLRGLAGLDAPGFDRQDDAAAWPDLQQAAQAIFRQRTRQQWLDLFAGSDACVAPVLTLGESRADEHLQARGAFIRLGGEMQAAPAPRFSRTPSTPSPSICLRPDEILQRWEGAPARKPAA